MIEAILKLGLQRLITAAAVTAFLTMLKRSEKSLLNSEHAMAAGIISIISWLPGMFLFAHVGPQAGTSAAA